MSPSPSLSFSALVAVVARRAGSWLTLSLAVAGLALTAGCDGDPQSNDDCTGVGCSCTTDDDCSDSTTLRCDPFAGNTCVLRDTADADTSDDADAGDVTDTSDEPDTADEPDTEDVADTPDVLDVPDEEISDVPDDPDTDTTGDPDTDTTDEPDTDTTDDPDTDTTDDPDTDTSDDPDVEEDTWTAPDAVNTPWIAFVSRISGLEQVSVVAGDGSGTTHIDTGDPLAYDPTWSPDGTQLAIRVLGSPYNVIRVVDVTTGAIETIEPALHRISSLAWSPDGSAIAFEGKQDDDSRSDVYIYDLGDESLSRLTTTANTEAGPTWPNPSTMAYVVSTDDVAFDLYTHDIDSDETTRRTFTGTVVGVPAVNWQLSHAVFVRRVGEAVEMVRYDIGATSSAVVGTPAATGPAMSPDGTWFAFVDEATGGQREIYLETLDGEIHLRVTNSAAGESMLDVAPVEASTITIDLGD